MEKKNVILRGPVLTQSGYGVHARQVAKWLLDLAEKRGDLNVVFEVLPWGITPWMVNPEAEGGLVGRILERCQKLPHYDVSLQLQLPNEWDPFLASFNIGITAGVETNKANPAWVDCLNRMDLVVVPSEFTKKTFMNSGEVTARVEVVPESWFEEIRTAGENNSLGDKLKLDTKFNFLLVGQFTGNNAENDRKNIAYTIKWIAEEFKDNPDVGLVIKTNSGRQSKADKRHCLNMLSQIVMQVKKGAGPKIYLLHGAMTNKEFADLYTHPQINALVTLTHGEGFGLPILEAATAGLPVIATDWSAHTEFLNQGKFIKVECTLGPIHQSRVDNTIFMPESKWAFPNEQDFKRKVRRFYNSPAIPKTWATELRAKLLNTHSPETISEKYTKLFEGII